MNKIYTTTVEEDPSDPEQCIITFPDEMMIELGWFEGDTISWDVGENGEVILSKKKE